MTFTIVLFFVGLVLLYYGADFLVDGSSRLALSFGVRPLIIGMTIVSFATSMPEMMVSLLAIGKGSSDIAVGNIVGSNIANIGLILGASALLMPLTVPRGLLWRELPIMIAATALLYGLSVDGDVKPHRWCDSFGFIGAVYRLLSAFCPPGGAESRSAGVIG